MAVVMQKIISHLQRINASPLDCISSSPWPPAVIKPHSSLSLKSTQLWRGATPSSLCMGWRRRKIFVLYRCM
jgi:hypothetical protein